MSQLDLLAEIHAARPVAPAELRERVRGLAAAAPAPRRRITWRRAAVLAFAVAALAATAGVLGTRDGGNRNATEAPKASDTLATFSPSATSDAAGAAES